MRDIYGTRGPESCPAYLWHCDVQSISEAYCDGELTPDNIFKDGNLVDRVWSCDTCGMIYTETEIHSTME